METINLGIGDDLPPVDWNTIVERIADGSPPAPDAHNARTTWLTTLNDDGSPHVTAVGALWLDGTFWFQTGAGTKKHHNVERDPRCSIAVSVRDADVVVDGHASRVTDPPTWHGPPRAGRKADGRLNPIPTERGSPHPSTRLRRAHRRGMCTASSPALRP
jgi:Pyridoxamine 5'-phosphate oxidase